MSSEVVVLDEVSLKFPHRKGIIGTITNLFNAKDNDFTALKQINLTIPKGEILGIIGKNGSGKSTLLQCMAGIYQPSKGKVRTDTKPYLLAGVGTGYSSGLTGRENIILLGTIIGMSKEEVEDKIPELVAFAELEEWIDEPLKTYSSGMNARLGMAGIAYFRPNVLLIDEVLGVGDPSFKEKSKAKIMEMVGEASTVMLASHSHNLLIDICDRVIFLEKGKIKAIGDPRDVVDVYYDRKKPHEVSPTKRE